MKTKSIVKVSSIIIIIIIITITSLAIWLYQSPLSDAKIRAFSLLPFPAATVNGSIIPVSKFIQRYNLAGKIGSPQADSNIIQELINEKEVSLVAQSKGVGVSSKETDADYNKRAAAADLEGQKNFDSLLSSYGLNQESYKTEVIKPQLFLNNLQTWFYSQQDLNQNAYNQANDLVQKIQKGDNIAVLAQQYSQEPGDISTSGDLGFVDPSGLLPELVDGVESMKVGDVKIIPSRYGLHIIKLVDVKDNQLHLDQIFLNGSNFGAWYNNEIKNYNIKVLIKN